MLTVKKSDPRNCFRSEVLMRKPRPSADKWRMIRLQLKIVEAFTADLILAEPKNYAELKFKLDEARRQLREMEFTVRRKSKPLAK
jgi:hypothetical protein